MNIYVHIVRNLKVSPECCWLGNYTVMHSPDDLLIQYYQTPGIFKSHVHVKITFNFKLAYAYDLHCMENRKCCYPKTFPIYVIRSLSPASLYFWKVTFIKRTKLIG